MPSAAFTKYIASVRESTPHNLMVSFAKKTCDVFDENDEIVDAIKNAKKEANEVVTIFNDKQAVFTPVNLVRKGCLSGFFAANVIDDMVATVDGIEVTVDNVATLRIPYGVLVDWIQWCSIMKGAK